MVIEQHARQALYKPTSRVLQEAIGGAHPIGAMASPHEYAVVDHEATRTEGVEPSSVLSYPARNFGYLGLVPPNEIFLALMPDRPSLHAFVGGAQQIAQHYGFGQFEPVWGPDPLERVNGQPPIDVFEVALSQMIPDVAAQIRAHFPTTTHFAAIQHANTQEGRTLQARLGQEGIAMHSVYGPKPYEYPNFGDRSGFSDFARRHGLPIPPAVVSHTREEMVTAYQQVAEQTGNPLIFMKLAGSGGGYGVQAVENAAQVETTYQQWDGYHMFGPINEGGQPIPVEFQGAIPAIVDICSFQYSHGYITTPQRREARGTGPAFTRQMIHGTDWVGNGYGVELHIPPEHRADAERVIAEFQARFMDAAEQEMGATAWKQATGGIDFALVDLQTIIETQGIDAARNLMNDMWEIVYDEKRGQLTSKYAPVIIEHNGLRESDAKQATVMAEALGLVEEGIPFAATKVMGIAADLPTVWQFMVEHGLEYNPETGEGMVPIAWIYDPEAKIFYANILVASRNADTQEDLLEVRTRIIKQLEEAGLVTKAAEQVE